MEFGLPDLVGTLGVIVTLLAYVALQTAFLKVEGFLYSTANALGSLFILYSLFFHWNFSAALIEICWLIISLFGAFRYLRKKINSPT